MEVFDSGQNEIDSKCILYSTKYSKSHELYIKQIKRLRKIERRRHISLGPQDPSGGEFLGFSFCLSYPIMGVASYIP